MFLIGNIVNEKLLKLIFIYSKQLQPLPPLEQFLNVARYGLGFGSFEYCGLKTFLKWFTYKASSNVTLKRLL